MAEVEGSLARWPKAALLAVALAVLPGCGGSSSPLAPTTSGYEIPVSDLADMLSEKSIGSTAASVSLVDYSSLTCPHCATFHLSTLPLIKAAYIDTGKVKFVYRDFPVPGASTASAAYAAAALARCAGSPRYFEALDLLYKGQSAWTGAADPTAAMKQVLAPIGMASDKMNACVASADVRNEINRLMSEARATYEVSGTPTFIVNGQKIVGAASFAEFDAILRLLVK